MKITPKVRLNRLFRSAGSLGVAVDQGVCNEPSFLNGLADMDLVNLFMLPDEPDLFRQGVQNIARVRADCTRHGTPLMIEPLVMLLNDVRGGCQVDGDAEKIVTLVRLATEMGAVIIKADPTANAEDFHRVVEAARVPALARGGGKEELRRVPEKSAALIGQEAKGFVSGHKIYQHADPRVVVPALMAIIHDRADGAAPWDIYNRVA